MSSKPKAPLQSFRVNPAGWPEETLPLFARAITVEFASLTRQGAPITFPLTPYIGDDERRLDVSTGLTYPAKAERARRNPQVGMLYSDRVGTGLADAPTALVLGLASVRDANLQANTDRYLRLSLAKSPDAYAGVPRFAFRWLGWYFARIWIEVTPVRILWWPGGDLRQAPREWLAPEGTVAPPSDPAPAGKQPAPWRDAPADWRPLAADAAARLGDPILTTVSGDGFPYPMRVARSTITPDGFRLEMPAGLPDGFVARSGPACLTFHTHPEVFTGQENHAFVGEVSSDGGALEFRVERALGDWSMVGSRMTAGVSFAAKARTLAPRVREEAARRGQPVPAMNPPDYW